MIEGPGASPRATAVRGVGLSQTRTLHILIPSDRFPAEIVRDNDVTKDEQTAFLQGVADLDQVVLSSGVIYESGSAGVLSSARRHLHLHLHLHLHRSCSGQTCGCFRARGGAAPIRASRGSRGQWWFGGLVVDGEGPVSRLPCVRHGEGRRRRWPAMMALQGCPGEVSGPLASRLPSRAWQPHAARACSGPANDLRAAAQSSSKRLLFCLRLLRLLRLSCVSPASARSLLSRRAFSQRLSTPLHAGCLHTFPRSSLSWCRTRFCRR
jgi:hypothetical protein